MTPSQTLIGLAAAATLVAGFALSLLGKDAAHDTPLQVQATPPPGQAQFPSPSGAQPGAAAVAGERSVEQLHTALFVKGSLRGTDLAGDWGSWVRGRLQASHSLRLRFDQLLSTLGEANETELRRLLQALAQQELGDEKPAQILSLWDRYIALLKQPLALALDMNRPETWLAVLETQHLARRNALGADWAEAFYHEEERHLRDFATARQDEQSGKAAPMLRTELLHGIAGLSVEELRLRRVQEFGAAATQRLEQVEAEQKDWQQRLAQAQREWSKLKEAVELSDLQRLQAMTLWVQAHFSDAETPRIKALLQL